MANSMKLISKRCFPKAVQVTDRFHVQKLALEALQEIRIKYRWEAMDAENQLILQAKREREKKKKKTIYQSFYQMETL
ncbi:transposase [Flavobacterium sp. FlaQc-57]|uniref:transposase n=1 Tax=Flavobacterium sp. FlaQc-57 TaxID=3374186 RepID=UPI0037565D0A